MDWHFEGWVLSRIFICLYCFIHCFIILLHARLFGFFRCRVFTNYVMEDLLFIIILIYRWWLHRCLLCSGLNRIWSRRNSLLRKRHAFHLILINIFKQILQNLLPHVHWSMELIFLISWIQSLILVQLTASLLH